MPKSKQFWRGYVEKCYVLTQSIVFWNIGYIGVISAKFDYFYNVRCYFIDTLCIVIIDHSFGSCTSNEHEKLAIVGEFRLKMASFSAVCVDTKLG